MDSIALDVAAGVFLGSLPVICAFMSMLKRKQGDFGRAFAYGLFSVLVGLFLVVGGLDPSVWR